LEKKNGADIRPPADIGPVRASLHGKDRRGGDLFKIKTSPEGLKILISFFDSLHYKLYEMNPNGV